MSLHKLLHDLGLDPTTSVDVILDKLCPKYCEECANIRQRIQAAVAKENGDAQLTFGEATA